MTLAPVDLDFTWVFLLLFAPLLVAMVFVPILVARSDAARRRLYAAWREGVPLQATPQQIQTRKQLSIRGILLITTLAAIFVSYLRNDSIVDSPLLGLACVISGIAFGLDYKPRGIPVLRDHAMSGVFGGLVGVLLFSTLQLVAQVLADKAMPRLWFWSSLGRLSLIWSCIAVVAGFGFGSWRALKPFREQASRGDGPNSDKLRGRTKTPVHSVHLDSEWRKSALRDSGSLALVNYLPALIGSLLLHATVMTLQAGFLDVGTKLSSQHGRVATDEIEIIASIMQAKDDDALNFYSMRLERDDESIAASNNRKMRSQIDRKQNVNDAERQARDVRLLSDASRPHQPASEFSRDAFTPDGISVVQNDGTFGKPATVPGAIDPTVGTIRAPTQGDNGAETARASAGVSTRNLLVNGDFEARRAPGQSQASFVSGDTSKQLGWAVAKGDASTHVLLIYRRDRADKLLNQYLEFSVTATAYQEFETVPGMHYKLSFLYTHAQPADRSTSLPTETGYVRIVGRTSRVDGTFKPQFTPHRMGRRLTFEAYSATFVADSTKTRLEFSQRDGNGLDIAIDDVCVAATLE